MATGKLTLQRGNPVTKTITFTDVNGDPYDLTGLTVLFTVKHKNDLAQNDDDALIVIDIDTHTDEENGITELELSETDTDIPIGTYKWDLRLYSYGTLQVNTDKGICEVVEVVTKRTS